MRYPVESDENIIEKKNVLSPGSLGVINDHDEDDQTCQVGYKVYQYFINNKKIFHFMNLHSTRQVLEILKLVNSQYSPLKLIYCFAFGSFIFAIKLS